MSYYIRKKAVAKILDLADGRIIEKSDIVRIGVNEGLSSRSSIRLLQDLVYGKELEELPNSKWRRLRHEAGV